MPEGHPQRSAAVMFSLPEATAMPFGYLPRGRDRMPI
jgi:hypothetical protein